MVACGISELHRVLRRRGFDSLRPQCFFRLGFFGFTVRSELLFSCICVERHRFWGV